MAQITLNSTGVASSGALAIQTNGTTEQARIDNSGNLLVGTTSLRTTGFQQGNNQYAMESTSYGGAQWFVNKADDDGAYVVLGKSRGTTVNSNTVVSNADILGAVIFQGATGSGVASAAQIRAKVDGATINASSMPGRLEFYTTSSGTVSMVERARFNSTGALVFAGGTTTANGIGITFPATQSASTNANTLDDYEEGTWTPTLGGTSTYAKQVGEYVKVGQSVIYAGAISVSSIGTGSATGAISGLPFTASNIDVNAGKAGTVSFFNSLATSIASLGIYVDNAGTTLQTTTVAAGGATSTGTASIFQNSSKIDFAGSYKSSS